MSGDIDGAEADNGATETQKDENDKNSEKKSHCLAA